MSRVAWKGLLIPELAAAPAAHRDEHYCLEIPETRPYPRATGEFAIPDPRALRSMSRAAVFLSSFGQGCRDALSPFLARSPFSVGIYCAVENGPIDAASTAQILAALGEASPPAFSEAYRKFRNPKLYLKQLPNLAPAQLGIALGICGPMNVYTHSRAGSLHALDQAEWDLKAGRVQAAFVCSAHSFEDFLVVARARREDPRCLNEGAAALLLIADGEPIDWSERIHPDPKNFFGVSDPLINLLRSL